MKIVQYRKLYIVDVNLIPGNLRLSQLDSSPPVYTCWAFERQTLENDTIEYRDFVLVGAQLDYNEKNFQ